MNIIFIGSGNVATHMAIALKESEHNIIQVYSRTLENAEILANIVDADATDNLKMINDNADLYIFSLKDDAIEQTISHMPQTSGIWVHTAGSVPMDVFEQSKSKNKPYTGFGVIYPLQTFSKNKELNFFDVPVFIEGDTPETSKILDEIAKSISNNVRYMLSEKRCYLHLAAVFANNFSNHMFALASEVLDDENIPFDVLKPLITETVAKVMEMNPQEAQTGPAVRFDESIIKKHNDLIKSGLAKEIYNLSSKSIHKNSI